MTIRKIANNATLVCFHNKQVLFSYETPVAAWIIGRGYIQTDRHYSRTTTRHISTWLGGRPAEVTCQEEIDSLCG